MKIKSGKIAAFYRLVSILFMILYLGNMFLIFDVKYSTALKNIVITQSKASIILKNLFITNANFQ